MNDIVLPLIQKIIQVLIFAIFAQVIISWLVVAGVRNNLVLRLYHAVTAITTPIMRPLRRVIPTVGMIDITPMIAIILLVTIDQLIGAALH